MDLITRTFNQGTAKIGCRQKSKEKQSYLHISNAVVKDQTEQANNTLINMETTAAEDKDAIRTQL